MSIKTSEKFVYKSICSMSIFSEKYYYFRYSTSILYLNTL